MGEAQKIFYYHVPSAIAAYFLLFISCAASIVFLAKRSRKADLWARAGAEVGVVFILCALVTGSIWGRSAWGKWWVWEPRLTTFLVLLLMYVSYILIRLFGKEDEKTARAAAVLSIIAFLDVPLVNRAVAWWGSIVHPRNVTLEPKMWHTLMVSSAAVAVLAAVLLFWCYNHKLQYVSGCQGRKE